MTPEHVANEAIRYVENLEEQAYKEAEVRSMAIFPIAKMFGFLHDWPETYPELSQQQRCTLAYFGACIGVRELVMQGPQQEPLESLVGKKVSAVLDLPSGRREMVGVLKEVHRGEVIAVVETGLGKFPTSEVGSIKEVEG